MVSMAEIAVMGHGVVGSGVLEVLLSHTDSISKRAKEEIHVKRILDLREFPDLPYSGCFTKDFNDILNDPEIRIVVEVMGGLEPAYSYVKACLENGKSVVTSNKELVAQKGAELLALAQKNNLNFLFEASVGGGIPIIRPISQCLAANEMTEIAGILNGTTNFILTKMIREHMAFDDALALAQKLGYAERDPSADVEGIDACRKICILASLAYGTHVYPDSVHTEGITSITKEDVGYADAWGGVIKLIGEVKKLENGRVHIQVAPMFISRESQLANVDDVFNGILVRGDATGDVVFYGKGAGKLPTASAVVADVIDCVRHLRSDRKILFWEDSKPDYVQPWEDTPQDLFVRVSGEGDSDSLFDLVQQVFPEAVRLIRRDEEQGETGFTLSEVTENQLKAKIPALEERGLKLENRITIADF
jgi:homoserine dehydrogenase